MSEWIQFEVKRAPGAEALAIVRYRGGSFRIHHDAPLHEVMRGVREGWTMKPRTRASSTTELVRRYIVETWDTKTDREALNLGDQ